MSAPRYFLTQLRIEGFRGINNDGEPLELKFRADSVNSVFAVNAIGKSSIYDALCYAIFGTIPKLEDLHRQERPHEYYCNRFHSQGTATIDLEFTPDDGGKAVEIQVKRDAAGKRLVTSSSGIPDPEEFLASLREPFALLDYRAFSRFIEDSPLERGRTFSSLLGLSQHAERRQALQAISETRSLNNDFDIRALEARKRAGEGEVVQALAGIRTAYEKLTGKPITDTTALPVCAVEVVDVLIGIDLLKPLVDGKDLAELDFDQIKDKIRLAEGGEERIELDQVLRDLAGLNALPVEDLSAVVTEQNKIAGLASEWDKLQAGTRGELFHALFRAADAVIGAGVHERDDQCPLCEETLEGTIDDIVQAQLTQYKDAAEKAVEAKAMWAESEWKKTLALCEAESAMGIEFGDQVSPSFGQLLEDGGASREEVDLAVERSRKVFNLVGTRIEVLAKRKGEIELVLPPSLVQLTEHAEYARQFREGYEKYEEKQRENCRLEDRLSIRRRWHKFITSAASSFLDAETDLSKERIESIDAEYKELFRKIMCVADVIPELRRADGKQDVHVELSEFHGQQGLSAKALLSESYRNALAISVFLASAGKHRGLPRFVVLDDVTSSFDSGHQWHLMELLRSSLQCQGGGADGLQFILLSHDGLLEKYFDRLGGGSGWHHCKLHGAPPMGAVLSQAQGADRLRARVVALLAAGQVTEAGPLMRQYLEFRLQQIIRRVAVPVPIDFVIKYTKRVVGDCLDAIMAAVELHKKAGDLVLDAQQLKDLQSVHAPAIVGNWVSHYETGAGSSLTAAALQGVMATVDSFEECFQYVDTTAGKPVRKWYRSLSKR